MQPNRNNPTMWFAWYPVITADGFCWLRRVWWFSERDSVAGYRVYYRAMT